MLKTRLVVSGNDAGSQLRVQRSTGRALFAVLAMLAMQPAAAGLIDLNSFFVSPTGSVVVDSTGSSATMSEVSDSSVVLLSNDPGLGDPILINPNDGPNLRFQYAFTRADATANCVTYAGTDSSNNCDALFVTLFDAIGTTLAELVFATSGSGEASFDLIALGGANAVFGLQFELFAWDAWDENLISSARISLLEVYSPAAVTVPEPGSLALLLGGLIALIARRRMTSS